MTMLVAAFDPDADYDLILADGLRAGSARDGWKVSRSNRSETKRRQHAAATASRGGGQAVPGGWGGHPTARREVSRGAKAPA